MCGDRRTASSLLDVWKKEFVKSNSDRVLAEKSERLKLF
jgi:hypothetical protein